MPRADRLQWIKFFPEDWLTDRGLHRCGLAARGLWIELLCLMASHGLTSEHYGKLVEVGSDGSANIDAKELSLTTRIPRREIERAIQELEKHGVFSRDENGIIFSRRLVKDAQKYIAAARNGAAGGTAAAQRSGAANGTAKGTPKKQEARSEKQEARPGAEGSNGTSTHFDRLCKIAGIDMAKLQRQGQSWMQFPGLMLGWIAAGADPDKDIWPTIEHMLTSFRASNNGKLPNTPVYFSKAITESRDARLLKAKAAGRDWNFTITKGTDKAIKLTDAVLRNAKGFWEHGHWSSELGPSPVDPNFDWPDAAKAELLALRNEPIAESEWYGSRPPGWV